MFNPSNIDEVPQQAKHLEASKSKLGLEGMSKKLPRFEKQLKGRKEKGKKTTRINKGNKESICTHYQNIGHEKIQVWKLHEELLPNKFRWKQKITTTIQ